MKSTSSSSRSGFLFSRINKESSILMDQYLNNQIKNIPVPHRYRIIGKLDFTAESFMKTYQENILDNHHNKTTRYPRRYEGLTELYKALTEIGKGLSSRSVSEANFLKRCKVISGLIPIGTEEIRKYFDGPKLNFHLFACVNEIIFNNMEWTGCKREILNHYLGYSNRYEKLSKAELDVRLQACSHTVCDTAKLIERRIRDIIKAFKALAPYYSYKKKGSLNEEAIRITAEVINCMCGDEGTEGITPRFAAKVLSIIYDYRVLQISSCEGDDFWLIKGESAGEDKIDYLVNRIKKEVSAEQNKKVVYQIMKYLGQRY